MFFSWTVAGQLRFANSSSNISQILTNPIAPKLQLLAFAGSFWFIWHDMTPSIWYNLLKKLKRNQLNGSTKNCSPCHRSRPFGPQFRPLPGRRRPTLDFRCGDRGSPKTFPGVSRMDANGRFSPLDLWYPPWILTLKKSLKSPPSITWYCWCYQKSEFTHHLRLVVY